MKQWAILIGLDGYQFFQPLNCAQQDIQALHHFLVSEAGFPLNQCLLFTQQSPFLAGRSTYPSQENLCNWLEFLAQTYFQPDDQVWIFLNGYGVCHRGQDYFVPIDGNPAAIAATCMAIAPLLARLKAALPKGQPLLLLDINRSQSTIPQETVGIQTAQIAHQLGIPTILSCQPGQFSREISSLGHGLFTAALLEGLRYQQGATLETLSHYLSDRLPELSEHYWQPSQQPVTICPPHLVHKPLLSVTASLGEAGNNGHMLHSQAQTSQTQTQEAVETPYPAAVLTQPAVNTAPHLYVGSLNEFDRYSSHADSITPPPSGQNHSAYTANAVPFSNHSLQIESIENSYRRDVASATTLTMSNPAKLSAVESEPMSEPMFEPIEEEDSLWQPFLLWGSLISVGLLSAVLWRNWSVVLAAPASQQVAATERIQPVSTHAGGILAVGAPSAASMPSDGAVILRTARAMVQSDQATPYRDAIQHARKIQATDQSYQPAQQNIADWSQTIYHIAQERASRSQFNLAVMAADLVPLEDRVVRSQADAAIAQWCQSLRQQPSQSALQQAKSICRS